MSYRFRAEHDESLEIGTLMPAPISKSLWTRFEQYASAVVDVIGLERGIFHLEIILTDHGPEVVELNPRLMGGSLPILYERAYDFNIFHMLIKIYLNGSIPQFPKISKKYSLSCFFGSFSDGTMPSSFDLSWLDEYSNFNPDLHWYVGANGSFEKLQSNFSYIGRFILSSESISEAIKARDQILVKLENTLGFKITRPEKGIPPCLKIY